MDDTALVKRPVGDDLAVKVEAFRNGQLAEREKNEAPLKRRVLIESFLCLAERYFGVTRGFVKNLPKEERAEFLKQVFEEAKWRLRWQAPLIYISFVVSMGLIPWAFFFYHNKVASFPAFKLRRLYKWYMENYDADDLEKAVKSGDFDREISANVPARIANGVLVKKPEPREIVLPELTEGVLEASESAVESIGFSPAMLLEIKLSKFFRDKGTKIFKYKDILEYLKFQGGKEAWYWRPLREKDILKYSYSGELYDSRWYGYYHNSYWQCRPYSKLIPPRTRDIVEEIVRQFGDKVNFLVSYYTDQSSDKFIAAVALDMNMFIFDSWHDDELKQSGA